MKTKDIKRLLLESLFRRGVYHGMDLVRGKQDQFLGDILAREKWEEMTINTVYKELKKLI